MMPAGGTPPMASPMARPMRLPGMPGAAASPAYAGATPVYASGAPASTGGISLPGFGTASPTVSQPQQNTASPLSAEAQALLLEAQRQRYQQEGNPMANLLPSSALSRAQTPAASGNSAETTTKPWTPPRAPSLPPLPQ